jgi:hypothetical protein
MNEQMSRALALIAAELHLQNQMTVLIDDHKKLDVASFSSSKTVKRFADHFQSYFETGVFPDDSIVKLTVSG